MIADDLTGAADCGIQFTRAGYRSAVVFRGEPVPSAEEVDAVVIDTDSRSLDAKVARERVLEAGRMVKSARLVYKKLDSTLRGPIASELEAALEATGRSLAIIAPAFPATGRTTRDGAQMIHGEPVHLTDLARDPRNPVTESHVPTLLAEQSLGPVRTLGLDELASEESIRASMKGAAWIVADAVTDDHLEAIARAVPDPSGILWAGSAGLAWALGRIYPGPRPGGSRAEAHSTRNVLAVIGSVSGVAREQLRLLAGHPDVTSVALDSRRVAGTFEDAVGVAFAAARDALTGGRSVALHSTAEREEVAAERIAEALAEVARRLAAEDLIGGLVMTGGDTAVRVARGLGARGILLEEEIEAGVPVGILMGPRPYPVVTKAGGFGTPETLLDAMRALTGERKEP